jgi:anti-sigma regulatory factor (Ser/Thr protein kinase)
MRPSLRLLWLAEVAWVELDTESFTANELRLPALCSALSTARQYVGETAAAFGFDADSCYELVFAVNEAVTNAIRHGAPDEQGLITLSIVADTDCLTFVVRDCGTFAMPAPDTDTWSEHGRGFAFMASVMDEIQLRIKPGSTIVLLTKARA